MVRCSCPAEVDFDFGAGFYRLAVEVGGFVAPFADGAGYPWQEREGAVERLEVGDAAVFVHRCLDGDRARCRLMHGLWIDARRQFADSDLLAAAPDPVLGGDADRAADVDRHSR